ncbi:hypothetical protein BGZ76_001948, partial [Entomortierella beljakovae]
SVASPISPSRRYPLPRRDFFPTQQSGENIGGETEQGQEQDQQEDGDHEDEGLNDDVDGDFLSGTEDQDDRRRRHQRQKSSSENMNFTPARSAPQPPNLSGSGVPKTREAEIAHIMYIQQQQALFLQEKALNPPLRTKGSNGNLNDTAKPRRKPSHRKQISVISTPTLVSSTSHIKTVPIVRPADQSDNEDTGMKSEHTSGGEGIKKTVRKMRRAVRHAATGVFHDDDSDREEAVGSKSDVEKKGGLKQLKALRSKLAKRLHRPGQGGSASRGGDSNGNGETEGGRAPVQFFSEDNLRARYLAQEQQGGNSFASVGASLRRSNTTRDNSGVVPLFPRQDHGGGDKEEYDSTEEKEGQDGDQSQTPQDTNEEAAANMKKAKFASRTFDKDEMMEVNDGSGESFFVPRWDFDPRADELGSTMSVISVRSTKKLERSASSTTTASSISNSKSIASMAKLLQTSTVEEEETQGSEAKDHEILNSDTLKQTQETNVEPVNEDDKPAQADLEASTDSAEVTEDQHDSNNAESVSSSGLDSRASIMSEASSKSSVGIVTAQVLTRQSSMRRNFKRPELSDRSKESAKETSVIEETPEIPDMDSQMSSTHLGLGISIPSPKPETKTDSLEEPKQQESIQSEIQLSQEEPKSPVSDVRPLSPIRRTANQGGSPSMASVSSLMSGPTTPPVSSSGMNSPLDTQAKPELLKKNSIRTISIGSFTLPQAPSSPLPSPANPINPAPPATPSPAVIARQGSQVSERTSLRSMYTDSIYDYYDYDSASDHDEQESVIPSLNSLSNEKVEVIETKSDNGSVTTAAAEVMALGQSSVQTLAVSLNNGSSQSEVSEESAVTPTANKAAEFAFLMQAARDIPTIQSLDAGIPKEDAEVYKDEQHVHYEEIPAAVSYHMSIMTTVPIDPIGVAGSMSMPSRPPRHPMRRSRHGSINTLSSGFTSDSWISSSARNTRDDMSGWDASDLGSELARRPSTASTLSRFSRSDRTGSIMTDTRTNEEKLHMHVEDDSEEAQEVTGGVDLEASPSIPFPSENESEVTHKQWYNESRRDTWGTNQSSSSDSASSDSSSRSSHFYFNGRSPTPSPTEETAPTTGAF